MINLKARSLDSKACYFNASLIHVNPEYHLVGFLLICFVISVPTKFTAAQKIFRLPLSIIYFMTVAAGFNRVLVSFVTVLPPNNTQMLSLDSVAFPTIVKRGLLKH